NTRTGSLLLYVLVHCNVAQLGSFLLFIPATAVACPALWNAAAKFLYGSVQDYVDAITPFAQTPIMQATERQLKQCVQDSVTDKTALAFLVVTCGLPVVHLSVFCSEKR
uniref:Uncharacterized protein n=1 Tax=Apteryx owenii TaxID=8824 RepID=A0A8B9PIW0_APTOW